jgi:hypothetical protein
LKVLYVYADSPGEWNCSRWNCIIPTNSINRTKNHTAEALYVQEFIENTDNAKRLCLEADIIIVERNFFGDTLTMLQYWKVRGKTILAIWDDAYDIMHPENPSYDFWTNGKIKIQNEKGELETIDIYPRPLEQMKWGLRLTKGLQVPSANLAKDWSKYTTTYYVHNFLPLEEYLNVTPLHPHPEDEIWIGWCGSLSHYSSFTDSGILDAMRKIGKRYPTKVKFLISGEKRVYDMLETKNKIFQPFVPANQWQSLVKSLDIGLAPLSGEYDKRRSWIKALEYMALKIPWIASDYPTYSELRDYGFMVENRYVNWEHALDEMVTNYPVYKKLADNEAYEFAVSQSSDNNIEKVTLKLYEKLINEPYP